MTLDLDADPCGVTQYLPCAWNGELERVYWDVTEIDAALRHIARTCGDRHRMHRNGSPVLHEADLLEMRAAITRAQE